MCFKRRMVVFLWSVGIASLGVFLRSSASESLCEKPMVVVIPSYNNSKYYQKNLDSVFSQQYTNYRVIYIDDCSPDGTADLVRRYLIEHKQGHRVTFLRQGNRRGALANHYTAVHMCQNHEIIVQLDGDDWFKHDKVLETLNKAYQDPNVWLTYSRHETYPNPSTQDDRTFSESILRLNAYREHRWVSSALRTFYAGLFKRIKLQDLLYNGKFFDITGDLAFMFPMLEMTGGKFKFIDEILYVYNVENSLNDFKLRLAKQLRMDNVIRSRDKYEPLITLPYLSFAQTDRRAELVVFSENGERLACLLEDISLHLKGVGHITVFYASADTQSLQEKEVFKVCKVNFPEVTFVWLDSQKAVRPQLFSYLPSIAYDYFMFIRDSQTIADSVDLTECAELLEKTGAHAFYLGLSMNNSTSRFVTRELKTPPAIEFQQGVCAWQFAHGEYDWSIANSFHLTVYRKKDVLPVLMDLAYNSFDSLRDVFEKIPVHGIAAGLFFRR